MQLTYRSAQYEMNQYEAIVPAIETKQANGIYRGASCLIRLPKVEQNFQTVIQLQYRGVPYAGFR